MGPIEVTLKNLVNVGTVNISYIESLGMCMLPHIFLTWCMTSTWAVRKVPWRIFTACHGEPRRKTVLVGCSHSLGILAHLLRMVSNGTYKWPMRFVSVIGHPNHQLRIWRLMPRGHSIHEGNWKWRILRILKYCFFGRYWYHHCPSWCGKERWKERFPLVSWTTHLWLNIQQLPSWESSSVFQHTQLLHTTRATFANRL